MHNTSNIVAVLGRIASKYGAWIIVGLMLLEFGLEWRHQNA